MAFIRVWCEYDICGSFGGNNNEDVYEVNDSYTTEQVEAALIRKFKFLAEEVECESNLLEDGLMGWEWIAMSTLD